MESIFWQYSLGGYRFAGIFHIGFEIAGQVVVVEMHLVGFFANKHPDTLVGGVLVANAVVGERKVVGFTQNANAVAFFGGAVVENDVLVKGVSVAPHGFGFISEENAFAFVF